MNEYMSKMSALAQLVKKIEYDSCTPEMQRCIQYTDAMESTSITEWIDSVSTWEEELDELQVRKSRYNFMSDALKKSLPSEVVLSYQKRWERAEFSTVGYNYVSIDNVWAHVDPKHTLTVKKERDVTSDFAVHGRKDLTLSDLQRLQWGTTSDENTMLGVRPKIPGTRYVKVGPKMIGDFEFLVPEDFPVQLAERFGDKYYILSPTACPGFTFEGRIFERHPFVSPSEFVSEGWHEGIMILTVKGELRSKYLPTVDQEIDGEVWECCYNNGPCKVRPRPGKNAQNISQLFNCVAPKPVLMKDHQKLNRVVEITTTRFTTGRYAKGNVLYLDSGLRMDKEKGYPVRIEDAVFASHFEEGTIQTVQGPKKVVQARDIRKQIHQGSYKKQILGAKIFLLNGSGDKAFFLKEENKMIDFVGGKLEFGETPERAAIREMFEETGRKIESSDLVSIGYTDAEDDDAFFRSYMFLARAESWGDTCIVRSINSLIGSDNVPWFTRLIKQVFYNRTISMLHDMLSEEGGLLTKVHTIVLNEGRIKEGRLLTEYRRIKNGADIVLMQQWAKISGLYFKQGFYYLIVGEVPDFVKKIVEPTLGLKNTAPETPGWRSVFPYTNPALLALGDKNEEWLDRYVRDNLEIVNQNPDPALFVAHLREFRYTSGVNPDPALLLARYMSGAKGGVPFGPRP